MFLKFLEDEGESFTVTATIPNFKIGTTLENLKSAAQLEHERCIKIPELGKIAESEIANFYKKRPFSKDQLREHGNAETALTCLKEMKLQQFVLFANIHKLSSKLKNNWNKIKN